MGVGSAVDRLAVCIPLSVEDDLDVSGTLYRSSVTELSEATPCWGSLPVDIWTKMFAARFACKSPLDDSDIKIPREAQRFCKHIDAALSILRHLA